MYNSLKENILTLKKMFKNSADFTVREMNLKGQCSIKSAIITIEGMCGKDTLALSVINPLLDYYFDCQSPAMTSYGALAYVNKVEAELKEAAATLRVPPFDVSERVAADQKALKEMRTKAKRAKSMIGDDMFSALLSQVQLAPAGYPVIIARTEVRDGGQMRNMWDVVRSRMDAPGAMVVAGVNDGKPVLMAAGTDEAVAAGFNAGAIIKAMGPAIQGGGGGKPTMAQAGGKNPDGIDEALEIARNMIL